MNQKHNRFTKKQKERNSTVIQKKTIKPQKEKQKKKNNQLGNKV